MPLHSAMNTSSGAGRIYGGTLKTSTESFQTTSSTRKPATPMAVLVSRARRRRDWALAADEAIRSSAEGSCGMSLMLVSWRVAAFQEHADFARDPDVFGMAEGLGGDARTRQIHLKLTDDAAGPRRHHDDAV